MTHPLPDNWCELPTAMGDFRMYDLNDESLRLVCLGDVRHLGPRPLLRLHSSCLASEVFGALDCDCADQLRESMKLIAMHGRGLILHLHQEGRGQGLSHKIRAVGAMQREGLDTFEAFESLGLEQDTRTYGGAVEVLRVLGLFDVRLITNNHRKANFLREHGIVVETVPTHPCVRPQNAEYLRTKRERLGHALELDTPAGGGDVCFYHSDQPYGVFSNFSAHAVFLHGRIWPTTEHYYQSQKFHGSEREELVRCARTPTLAKRLATRWRDERRSDWSAVRVGVMREALAAKFDQHPDLRELLVRTRSRRLREHTELDSFWGDGGDDSGENMLGRLLMDVRRGLVRS